ncbi:hypothetical protein SASPL_131991 [Salvia splendens]|uniref:Cyclin-like domain-containing protein n=1 Tax=Salvia splendens TaxID=180675 RepID=A0A8X8XB76_SALSN|nr:hypothetical protein SASPL_131991 [Salvia splendens]
MEGGENQIQRRSRVSRKRPNQSAEEDNPMTKKRVVLGEITNISSNVTESNQNLSEAKIRKLKPESDLDKTGNEVNQEVAVSPGSGSDEPRRYGFAPSMLQYLRSVEVEAKRRPLSNYIEKVQDDINPVMRAILVDWLVEVAEEYKLVSDTLYLAVNYIDRYLSAHKVSRNKLQLLGVSCMLVASKYEEISPPNVEDFCYITDNTYTKEEGGPTAKTFLRIFTKAAQDTPMFSDVEFDFLCCYDAELSLLDYGCARYIPSMVALHHPSFLEESFCSQKFDGNEQSARAVRLKYSDHKLCCLPFSNANSEFKCVSSLKSVNPPAEVPAYPFE